VIFVNAEIPDDGDLVVVAVNRISPHGVYVTLDEFGGMKGFLHVSEISTGRVRHIEHFIRTGQKEVLKVIRVNKARGEVDLSLKQVNKQEKKDKLIEVKQNEKAKNILQIVKTKLNLDQEAMDKIHSSLDTAFGTLYNALEEVARNGSSVLSELDLKKPVLDCLEEVSKEKVTLPHVDINCVLEVTSSLSNGVDIIKEALAAAEKIKLSNSKITVSYLSAPKYRLVVQASDYKEAERVLKSAVDVVQDKIKHKGSVKIIRNDK